MPNLKRKGITLSEALQEAAVIAPVQRVVLLAYELWHPTMSAPIRFVNDKVDLVATLEADAPRNAGATVTFVACPMSATRQEESDSAADPETTLSRPDVSAIIKKATDEARGSLATWELIERVYASDDTSTPAKLPPLKLELRSTTVAGAAGEISAGFDDDLNQPVPRLNFTRKEYPGLLR